MVRAAIGLISGPPAAPARAAAFPFRIKILLREAKAGWLPGGGGRS